MPTLWMIDYGAAERKMCNTKLTECVFDISRDYRLPEIIMPMDMSS